MSRFGTLTLVVFLACIVTGCSLLYSYRNIDRYIRWSLDDYVSWSSVQDIELRTRLASQLEWSQKTQLPRYREWLETLGRTLENNEINAAQLAQAADQLQSFWQETITRVHPDIEAQLTSLSDDQVRDLMAVIREKQTDLKDEYDKLTPAELIKKRKRGMTKAIKYWLGSLDKKQISLIDVWAQSSLDGYSPWLNSRERWNDAFEKALQNRHDSELFSADIHRLFVAPQHFWSDKYRELARKNRESILQLAVEMHSSRTQKQRKAERKRIAQWLGYLDRLASH